MQEALENKEMNLVFSILMGLGLSASCGFRVFVPFLVMGIAAQSGHLTLSPSFSWLADTYTIIAFTVATFLEVGAYYIPWIDNLLDSVATPTAVIAGTLASASVAPEMSPLVQWTVAAIGGGGLATGVQLSTVALRGTSTATTGGTGNFLVSSAEAAGSATVSVLAIIMPLLVLLLLALLTLAFYRTHQYFKRVRTDHST